MIDGFINNIDIHLHSSMLMSYLAVYLGGFLVSLTPCVYPVIPITVAYVGGSGTGRGEAVIKTSVYILGMAITYTVLGAIAAFTGTFFGKIQSNPWTYFILSNIFILFGLSMLGVYTFYIPGIKMTGAHGKKTGVISGLFMGIVSGLVIGPCTAPVLGVVLGYVAARQNVVYGMSLLFVFAIGMGTILFFVGIFTGLMKSLPKPGNWMVWVQKIFGLVMLGIGEYFLFMAGRLSI
jgi:thiol:disulfide interchange protein DsbD